MAHCIPFPNLFPRPVPLLSMKQCHFTSHGNTQHNPQVQELLPLLLSAPRAHRELLSQRERTASSEGPRLPERPYSLTQETK